LDGKIREQLRQQGLGNLGSVGILDWPIEPIYGISCGFHCGGYPYAYLIGPHSGTDIPTSVGTPIHAPADGYVGRTHDSGGSGYSYILLVHGDNISTVYGHVSGFAVSEGKFVKRGDVIGYTGGAAGAHGSGLSSGPHLHFEVRKNNVAVDALNYLKRR
jgi:murein DD-endopeptidase MepM/ murein hydrolase activator NlpD